MPIDPEKLKAVRSDHCHETNRLSGFLGLCTCYQGFIAGFMDITKPLTQLMCKKGRPSCYLQKQKQKLLSGLMLCSSVQHIQSLLSLHQSLSGDGFNAIDPSTSVFTFLLAGDCHN
jgi:hypothetical protein